MCQTTGKKKDMVQGAGEWRGLDRVSNYWKKEGDGSRGRGAEGRRVWEECRERRRRWFKGQESGRDLSGGQINRKKEE